MRIDPTQVQGLNEAVKALENVAANQVPFAMMVTLNRTIEEVNAAVREHMAKSFTVRVPSFVLPPVQLPASMRATKKNLRAEAGLGYDDGGKNNIGRRREQIFRKFESGGVKQAKDPNFPIAIPTAALRSNFSQLVPSAMYPQNLRLSPKVIGAGEIIPGLKRGKVRTLGGATIGKRARKQQGLEGIGGTFTILGVDGKPIGIFQRTGKGKADVRMIWAFEQTIRIPDLLDFFPIAERIVAERLLVNWEGARDLAIRSAK